MATAWYLLDGSEMTGGFDSGELQNLASNGFVSALNSDAAVNVELCNYDLSVCTPIRAIIQNNTANTKSNTMIRQVLTPIGTCKAGMYIKYKNRYWLIVGLVDDNTMYEKSVVALCNYNIAWLNDSGQIIRRWVSAASASQYNNGETSSEYYRIRTDQLMVLTPDDDECLLLHSGIRLIIDKRCKIYERMFSEDTVVDTTNPVIVYQITRVDSVLFDYQDSGHSEFMAYQDEQHENDGYYVINGEGYWLCDIPKQQSDSSQAAEIECDCDTLYPQIDPCIFTARFYDLFGDDVEAEPIWEIESDVKDKLSIDYVGNSVIISTNDMSCINHTIKISLHADSFVSATKEIQIRAFF